MWYNGYIKERSMKLEYIDWNRWKRRMLAATCVQFAEDRGITSKHTLKLRYADEIVDVLVSLFTACCRCEGDEEYWEAKRVAIGNQVASALCTRTDAALRRSTKANAQSMKHGYKAIFEDFWLTFDEDLTYAQKRRMRETNNVRNISAR
jgi:hypothetical protein